MMPTERVFHGIGKTVCAPPLQKWEETERERERERGRGQRVVQKGQKKDDSSTDILRSPRRGEEGRRRRVRLRPLRGGAEAWDSFPTRLGYAGKEDHPRIGG